MADLSGFDLRLHVFSACPEVTQQGGTALLIITSHFPVLRNALIFRCTKKVLVSGTDNLCLMLMLLNVIVAWSCFLRLRLKKIHFLQGLQGPLYLPCLKMVQNIIL